MGDSNFSAAKKGLQAQPGPMQAGMMTNSSDWRLATGDTIES